MKLAIYIRVSTEDQVKEGYSLEVQREYLESFADREGHPHGFASAKQDMGTCEVYKIY